MFEKMGKGLLTDSRFCWKGEVRTYGMVSTIPYVCVEGSLWERETEEEWKNRNKKNNFIYNERKK